METVFITIHDLSLDARIRYCSDSISEILGYRPNEVKGKSCWEYFHPDEIPFAKEIEGQDLHLDTAASLKYCRIKHKDGSWIGCECVFTVVHDVLVASTAIYKRGSIKNHQRLIDGEAVRRIFATPPRDPRYHMLAYLAKNFSRPIKPRPREPRAAIILNRFSRTSTVMFATNGVEQVLGLSPTQLIGKSFYHCIADGCLNDAVRTLESAKGNDSIAYMRFYFRDPNSPDPIPLDQFSDDSDAESEDGGAPLSRASSVSAVSRSSSLEGVKISDLAVEESPSQTGGSPPDTGNERERGESTDSSGHSSNSVRESIFDGPIVPGRSSNNTPASTPPSENAVEVEAVVSCSSDGLVLVLRNARPIQPDAGNTTASTNGIFASPWATTPVLPDGMTQASVVPDMTFPDRANTLEATFMDSIQDIAVFAWSLTGINGSIVDHATGPGEPRGEALPPGGLPIWDPNAPAGENDQYNGFSSGTHRPIQKIKTQETNGVVLPVDCDGINGKHEESASSDDEVLWKRVPQIPPYIRPKRRAQTAFSDDDSSDGGAPIQDRRRRKLINGNRQNSNGTDG